MPTDRPRGPDMFEALERPEDPAVARVYYELANLSRYDIEWEWISHQAEGEYLLRDEVLAVVERYLAAPVPRCAKGHSRPGDSIACEADFAPNVARDQLPRSPTCGKHCVHWKLPEHDQKETPDA